ncbi:type II toxin-antitoxin system VapC family toxin [Cyanobium sp. Alchichica 3B3-8F6]|uniref:type II toxin-antitoxin system VapC family toxin n=1 Tax=Synechococcales TaxID=1890424 RepID=UPI000B99C406|nr:MULTISPECIES: type II toxin-antitoxin system VapC family toxin [Synechococcales]MCP9882272.1 type II toxin-antitoxin system VapC family toxin [Cyanobium sp. Alchichica 3B3-8F6]MCP9942367.1 type II toxin-antitoxin system VapC family toxin [Cyanobium sp. ATX 6E8]
MILLDTHVLLWLDRDDAQLGSQARQAIREAWEHGQVAVSAISFWEAAMLERRGRIQLGLPPARWRADWLEAGLLELPLEGGVALQAVELDAFHADPADRFIAATAIWHRATLLTADQAILNWAGSLERLDGRH